MAVYGRPPSDIAACDRAAALTALAAPETGNGHPFTAVVDMTTSGSASAYGSEAHPYECNLLANRVQFRNDIQVRLAPVGVAVPATKAYDMSQTLADQMSALHVAKDSC